MVVLSTTRLPAASFAVTLNAAVSATPMFAPGAVVAVAATV